MKRRLRKAVLNFLKPENNVGCHFLARSVFLNTLRYLLNGELISKNSKNRMNGIGMIQNHVEPRLSVSVGR